MYSDGNQHDLEWFDNVFADVDVQESTYAEESALGLYDYIGAFPVPEDSKKINFDYKDDRGNLLKRETVPVLYYGKKGDRGSSYLGAFSVAYNGTTVPYTINPPADVDSFTVDDFFLDTFDGYIYVLRDTLLWDKVTDYSDTRYKQAMNDMIANAGNTAYSQQFMGVVNLWVQNLTAQTALINQLFAKEITMQEGGLFKSNNYNESAYKGWQIDYEGNANFYSISASNIETPLHLNPGNVCFGSSCLVLRENITTAYAPELRFASYRLSGTMKLVVTFISLSDIEFSGNFYVGTKGYTIPKTTYRQLELNLNCGYDYNFSFIPDDWGSSTNGILVYFQLLSDIQRQTFTFDRLVSAINYQIDYAGTSWNTILSPNGYGISYGRNSTSITRNLSGEETKYFQIPFCCNNSISPGFNNRTITPSVQSNCNCYPYIDTSAGFLVPITYRFDQKGTVTATNFIFQDKWTKNIK